MSDERNWDSATCKAAVDLMCSNLRDADYCGDPINDEDLSRVAKEVSMIISNLNQLVGMGMPPTQLASRAIAAAAILAMFGKMP